MSKIKISYRTYPGCPQATAYSLHASKSAFFMGLASIWGFILSLVLLPVAKGDLWLCVAGLIGFPALALYTHFLYPKKVAARIEAILLQNQRDNSEAR